MKQIGLTLSLLAMLISVSAVMAQEEVVLDEEVVAQDLEIQDPTMLPDSPFYFIKSWSRGIQGFFTFNPVDKAALKQRFASEKLIEVKKMIEERRDEGVIGDAIEKYKKEVEEVEGVTRDIKERAEGNEKVSSFLDKYIKQQTLHQRLLQKLEEQVPPHAFEKIKAARERHLEKFGEVMNRLEENKERLQQRLEKNLEEVKGSDFKEFKNLEVLKQLEEKVPEQAKEAIRRAIENTLRRLEIKLEQSPDGSLEKFKTYTESISGEKERHEEILENLKDRLEDKPAIQQKIIESLEKVRSNKLPVTVEARFYSDVKGQLKSGDFLSMPAIRQSAETAMTADNLKFKQAVSALGSVDDTTLQKGIFLSATADVQSLINNIPSSVNWVFYNMEPGMTPAADFQNPVNSIKQFATAVHNSGRKFGFAPSRALFDRYQERQWLEEALKVSDMVLYQGQLLLLTTSEKEFVEIVKEKYSYVKGVNPNIEFHLQLWLGRQTPDEMSEVFNRTANYMDNAVIGTHSDLEGILKVLPQLKWRDPNPSCLPRPSCLDSTPRCLLPEPVGGWCPSSLSKVCTEEAKQCPDGSYVGRTGPNCEFSSCPSQ